jgi:hypothetical protein
MASPSARASSSNAAGSVSMIDVAGPPDLILKDTAPAHLAASLYLSVGGYDASTRNVTEMAVSFSSQGRRIGFVAGETLTCNGLALQRGGGTFDLKVSTDTFAGKGVTCTYRSGPNLGTIAFTAPVAPAILSPQENSVVTRSARTPVTFRIGGHSTMFYVIALGPSSKAWSDPAGTRPPQVLLDTRAFLPGPGFVALNQFFDLLDLHSTGFQSVELHGQAVQQIGVTWA